MKLNITKKEFANLYNLKTIGILFYICGLIDLSVGILLTLLAIFSMSNSNILIFVGIGMIVSSLNLFLIKAICSTLLIHAQNSFIKMSDNLQKNDIEFKEDKVKNKNLISKFLMID